MSLAWILVHLYSEPELLSLARDEIRACSALDSYAGLSEMAFLNSCIDESVRLHTMLPGNTVLRKAVKPLSFDDVEIPRGSLLWLYPNAVHQDENFFHKSAAFCPMRFLRDNNLKRMSDDYELVRSA